MNIRKNILLLIIIFLLINTHIIIIKKNNNKEPSNFFINETTKLTKDNPIATIIINKIKLKENLYDINSKNNTIEKHVSFLKESDYPDKKHGTVIILAHSGIGKLAYFKNLDKLTLDDKVVLIYKNITYHYKVTKIIERVKDGTIRFKEDKEKDNLILTTCKPHDSKKQLTIILEKEKSPN